MLTRRFVPAALAAASLMFAADRSRAADLVVNGGFEDQIVTNPNGWDIYYPSIPGWTVEPQQFQPPLGIEVWRGVNGWLAAEGKQNVELDADNLGKSGGPSSIAIYQDLSTTPGDLYNISFAFSPRPGVADNQLLFSWDGNLIDTLSANGSALSQTSWTYFNYQLKATGATTRIRFADGSKPDSLGTLLDAVTVTAAVPEPASLAMVGLAGLVGLGAVHRHRRVRR